MTSPASNRLSVPFVVVTLVALAAFAYSLGNKLSYDARFLVQMNATFKEAASQNGMVAKVSNLTDKLFHEEFWDGVNRSRDPGLAVEGQALYRPLMLWPMGMIYLAVGGKSFPYHLLDVLYHIGCSLLVFVLMLRLFADRRAAWIGALLFAAHPVHTEAVAYAAGLGETQSLFFGLAAIVLYLKSAGSHVVKPGKYLLALVLFAISLFTKESGAIALVTIILADVVRRRDAPPLATRLLLYAGFVAIIAVNIFVRVKVCGRLDPNENGLLRLDNPLVKQPFMACLATGSMLYTRALQLFVFPVGMSADYSFNQLPIARGLDEPIALMCFALVAILTVIGFVSLRRAPIVGFGILIFLFAFGPVSNILVRIGTIFGDRLLYQPSLGLAVAAGGILSFALGKLAAKGDVPFRVGRSILQALLVLFVVMTANHSRIYRDERTLFTSMTKTAPQSARGWFEIAETERFERQYQAAAADFRTAIGIMPDLLLAHTGLALSLAGLRDYKTASQIVSDLLKGIPDRPTWKQLRNMLTQTLQQIVTLMKVDAEAKKSDRDFGVAQLLELLEDQHKADPANIEVVVNLSELYVQDRKLDEASKLIESALLAAPTDERLLVEKLDLTRYRGDRAACEKLMADLAKSTLPEAARVISVCQAQFAYNDGIEARQKGDKETARALFDKAKELWDNYLSKYHEDWVAYFARGCVFQDGFDRPIEASEDFKKAIELNPAADVAYDRLSVCAIRIGRFDTSVVKLMDYVDEHYPKSPAIKRRCARVYSAVGNHEKAAKKLQEAIDLGLEAPDIYLLLSGELNQLGKPEEALALLQKGESLGWDPNDPLLHDNKGSTLLTLHREPEALEEFQKALDALAKRPDAQSAVLHARLQIAKALIRIKGREKEGLDALNALQAEQERIFADVNSNAELARSAKVENLFVLRQKAWVLGNVETMKDPAQELALLEEMIKRGKDVILEPAIRVDLLTELADAYDRGNQAEAAQKVRDQIKRLELPDSN